MWLVMSSTDCAAILLNKVVYSDFWSLIFFVQGFFVQGFEQKLFKLNKFLGFPQIHVFKKKKSDKF